MKRFTHILALLAAPASAQTTTCFPVGNTVQCNTPQQPSAAPGPNFRLLQPQPDFGAAAIAGFQAAQAIRAQREAAARAAAATAAPSEQEQHAIGVQADVGVTSGEVPHSRPTARQVYVACDLMLEGTDVPLGSDGRILPTSARMCRLLANFYKKRVIADPPAMQICLPDSLIAPEQEMAVAYIEFFNGFAELIAKQQDGPTSFVVALARKWPCKA